MKKIVVFVLVCFCLSPLAFANVQKLINDNRLDVNGSVFDANFVTQDTAVWNFNNGGGGALEVHLNSAEYTSYFADYFIGLMVKVPEWEYANDLLIDAHSPEANSTVSIRNDYPGNYVSNLDVEGKISGLGFRYKDMGIRPACNENLRGQTWFTEKGVFFADQLCICKKDRIGVYNWVNMAREDNLTGYLC